MREGEMLQRQMEIVRAKLCRTLEQVGFDHQHPNVQEISVEFDKLHNQYLALIDAKSEK